MVECASLHLVSFSPHTWSVSHHLSTSMENIADDNCYMLHMVSSQTASFAILLFLSFWFGTIEKVRFRRTYNFLFLLNWDVIICSQLINSQESYQGIFLIKLCN